MSNQLTYQAGIEYGRRNLEAIIGHSSISRVKREYTALRSVVESEGIPLSILEKGSAVHNKRLWVIQASTNSVGNPDQLSIVAWR